MKKHILIILFITGFKPAQAQQDARGGDFLNNMWTRFVFGMDEVFQPLDLYFYDDTIVRGRYFENCEKKILFKGERIKNDLVLTGYYNNKKYRYITLSLVADAGYYYGYMYDSAGGNRTAFRVSAAYSTAGTINKRYTDFGNISNYLTDDDAEDFASSVKAAVIAGDKEWLANHVDFPTETKVNGKVMRLKTKQDFLSIYDQIVTPEVKIHLQTACPYNLDFSKQGVMMDIFTIHSRSHNDQTLVIGLK